MKLKLSLVKSLVVSCYFIFFLWSADGLATNCGLVDPLNFKQIEDCLKKHGDKINSVEAMLSEFPEKFKRRYTLMHTSRSLQKASYNNPRVIMYGEGPIELVLTFNGERKISPGEGFDPDGYSTIELIQWDKLNKEFEFREIRFPSPANKLKVVKVSDKNPERCFKCHGMTDLRPNWQHYRSWPGAYAGDDDRVSEADRPHLEKFFKYAKTHPRYRYLIHLEERYRPDPLQEKNTPKGSIPITVGLHNSVLLEGLAELNFMRITKKLRSHPWYEDVKFALMDYLICQSLPIIGGLEYFHKHENTCGWNIQAFTGVHIELSFILSHMQEMVGRSIQDWFMDFRPADHYSFETPGTFATKWAGIILREDSDFQPYLSIVNKPFVLYGYPNYVAAPKKGRTLAQTCHALGRKSQISWGFIKQKIFDPLKKDCQKQVREKSKSADILAGCIGCHKNEAPFDGEFFTTSDIDTIKYYISERAGTKRMPLDRRLHLSPKEQAEFIDYLRKRVPMNSMLK